MCCPVLVIPIYKKTKIFPLLLLVAAFFSCSEDIMDKINENPNNPVDMASRLIITDVMTSTAFNVTGSDYAFYTSVYMELNTGIWGQMYNAEIRLAEPINASTYNNPWRSQYYNLYHLKIIIEKCSEGGSEAGNYQTLGIAQILKAYNLAMLTDLMGDAPYAEALQPGEIYQTKLDKQQEIYHDMMDQMKDAVGILKSADPAMGYPGADPIYDNNLQKWQRYANSLRLRLAMRARFADPEFCEPVIADCMTEEFIVTNDQNFGLKYQESENPELYNPW